MTGNLQADGVQSRQTLFVRYCLKVLRLYLDTGNAVLKHLPYADSYNTLYAGVIGSPVREMPIESSIGIVPPDLKRYDSLLKGGDAV